MTAPAHSVDYDFVTIGGGPSGLMCALTGMTGIPINPPRHFSGLLLEAGEVGQFAKYGKLRLTHQWSYNGARLVHQLHKEAAASRIAVHQHEPVQAVEDEGATKIVVTARGRYRTRQVAVCTGFFPYGHLCQNPRNVRVVFSPAEVESYHLPVGDDETVAICGGGPGMAEFAAELQRHRPGLAILLLVDDPAFPLPELPSWGRARHARIEVAAEDLRGLDLTLTAPLTAEVEETVRVRFLLVDYNSYTLKTRVTDFLAPLPVERRSGYIVTDDAGRTAVPGIVAAGNVTTPVSGVLTALDTGFKAGLTVYDRLYRERFGTAPLVFPWLPREGPAAHPLAPLEKEGPHG